MIERSSRMAAIAPEGVQSPGSSKPHERRNRNEKPSTTVMAVITPERKPSGIELGRSSEGNCSGSGGDVPSRIMCFSAYHCSGRSGCPIKLDCRLRCAELCAISTIGVTEETQQTSTRAWRDRVQAMKNIPPVLRIVWDSGPWVVALGLAFRVLAALVPAAASVVGKYILDLVAAIAKHQQAYGDVSRHLWLLVALEFGLVVLGNVFG